VSSLDQSSHGLSTSSFGLTLKRHYRTRATQLAALTSGGRGDIFHRLGAIIAFIGANDVTNAYSLNSICSNRGGLVA
jgi:hypothetical protein